MLIILLHLPFFQSYLGSEVADALSRKFGTNVSVGNVDLGFFNRIIVDDVTMLDQKNDSMFKVSRLSAKFEYIPLINGKIEITSAQLFGLNAKVYKQNADAKLNCQFVLDSLASKDTTKHTPLDLKINSLIIRHGSIKYDRRDIPVVKNKFNANHLNISNLSAHFILNHLTDNSIDLNIKKLSFLEKSGIDIRSLKMKFIADDSHADLQNFDLQLPNTDLSLGRFNVKYEKKNGKIEMPTVEYTGSINNSTITPSDLSALLPLLKTFNIPIHINSDFTGTSTSLHIKSLNVNSDNNDLILKVNGRISDWEDKPRWFADVNRLSVTAAGIQKISSALGTRINVPKVINRLGDIFFCGKMGGNANDIALKGIIRTDAGNANLAFGKHNNIFTGRIETTGINVKKILNDKKFGTVTTRINIDGSFNPSSKLPAHLSTLKANGSIGQFDYNGHTFKNILLNADMKDNIVKAKVSVNDPIISCDVDLLYNLLTHSYNVNGGLQHLSPSHLIGMHTVNSNYMLNDITVSASNEKNDQHLDVTAPFASIHINGEYNFASITKCFTNLIGSRIPTLPGLPKLTNDHGNNFSISANVVDGEWLRQLFKLPIALNDTIGIHGSVNDYKNRINMSVSLPDVEYKDMHFKHGFVDVSTPNDTLFAKIKLEKINKNNNIQYLSLNAAAADNKIATSFNFNNNSHKLPFKGQLNANTQFFVNENGEDAAKMSINPSDIIIGDSIWNIQPSEILYSKNKLEFHHFAVQHAEQHLFVNGLATKNKEDSLFVDLQNIDVGYVLNLVNFHSVDFTGLASGRAYISSAFNDPDAKAVLDVKKFTFEDGEMGTLYANCLYNKSNKSIDIDATADDGPGYKTIIKGFVSPANSDIHLDITAQGTRMQFLQSFTGSIMSNVDGHIYGNVAVTGPFSNINLVGDVHATGSMHMKQLNTDYHFENIHVTAVPNEISLVNDTVFDRNGNIGIVNGGLHHINLSKLSYDINVEALNLLSYDTHDFGDNTFYGTVYATGTCGIHGKSGEINIDVNATPERGTTFVYDASSPEAIGDYSFIHWNDLTNNGRTEKKDSVMTTINTANSSIPSDLKINFLINSNPNLTLKIIMNKETNDYIALNGDGVIKANYFNKGSFDMFGNYVVDHGIYKFTVNNVLKKDFQILQGGTISFGGDPYNAVLNLMAKYTVNGVSLSDLKIGKSFSGNNIRVDCLMNITGTPNQPKVDFSLDMPTVGNDAKQMVMSLINSEEEMKQQVLYLLVVGRFYVIGNNNAAAEDAQQQSQTSLAMQSLLSGTISQQINNVLSSVVNNNNWNFGANISTGDEGWSNAEYEGILSGRIFNNRLVFNGQFGYRDNANTTTSFIGDFDLRYLLYPNGNLAVTVYNQTNDRYFTRNSMNTQGLGLIMKKDFNGWRELFGINNNKKKKKKVKTTH